MTCKDDLKLHVASYSYETLMNIKFWNDMMNYNPSLI